MMAIEDDQRIFEVLVRLTKTLGELLGSSSEVVLHDLRQQDRSVVAISNPQVTGRKVGDTLDAAAIHLFQTNNFEDMANFETRTKLGKLLRSCSVFVRDDEGQAIGALCVHQDMSALLKLREWLDQMTEVSRPVPAPRLENNVEDVLSDLIGDAIRSTGKSPGEFSREDKVAVISYLDARGAFLIRYSMEKVASLLGISKFSIYNYLGDMRTETDAETAKV